jgi:rifampicin phosphotransferase
MLDRAPLVEWPGRLESGADAVGGKAMSLDRLARFGFRIPPGFCLTTAAFEAQIESLPGNASMLRALTTADGPESEAGAAAALTTAITSARLDGGVAEELSIALRQIDELAVRTTGAAARLAVRSSALGEDGSTASYAGLHETELDRAVEEVPAAVQRCWASLWSAPALAYRRRRGLPLDGAAMAVVVQLLVPADAAAVAFTRHPVTGRDDQLVVTAIRGLGEAMVSGTVTPDTYVVDRATRRPVEYTPGDDLVRPLTEASLSELVALCLDVEARFGAPVDVEAAIHRGTWYLLQARPITTGVAPQPA